MSDSVRPHGLQPTRLLCPWNSPGKNTGVGCHFLLQKINEMETKRQWKDQWNQKLILWNNKQYWQSFSLTYQVIKREDPKSEMKGKILQEIPQKYKGSSVQFSSVAQSCPTLRDPMGCSLPGFSVHGIFQGRVLEWGACHCLLWILCIKWINWQEPTI